jgi:hypothetical protein
MHDSRRVSIPRCCGDSVFSDARGCDFLLVLGSFVLGPWSLVVREALRAHVHSRDQGPEEDFSDRTIDTRPEPCINVCNAELTPPSEKGDEEDTW